MCSARAQLQLGNCHIAYHMTHKVHDIKNLSVNFNMLSLRRIESSSEFNTFGAATADARLVVSILVRGANRRGAADDRKVRPASYGCSGRRDVRVLQSYALCILLSDSFAIPFVV